MKQEFVDEQKGGRLLLLLSIKQTYGAEHKVTAVTRQNDSHSFFASLVDH